MTSTGSSGQARSPSPASQVWQRHGLLACALTLTGVGVLMGVMEQTSSSKFTQGVLLKTGIVTFMWWLALPQLRKLNPWMVGGFLALAIVAVVRPVLLIVMLKAAIPLAPILGLAWLFWKLKRKP